jgi:anti-anti-sigma factor
VNINEELLNDGVVKINLSGRMDIEGVGLIDAKFADMTAEPRMSIVVDLSGVPFMSSIGIRAVLMNAKPVIRRGGKFVLLSPQPDVETALKTSGVGQYLSICGNLDEAIARVTL